MFTHICMVCNKRISWLEDKIQYGKQWAHKYCVEGGIRVYVES